jgi:hypothetical protein
MGVFTSSLAAAFPTQDDQTPGTMAANFRRENNFWARFDAGFLDGKITSSPGTTKLDRRLENLSIVGFDSNLGRWGVRGNVKAEYSKRRQSEDEEPRSVVDGRRHVRYGQGPRDLRRRARSDAAGLHAIRRRWHRQL